MTWSVRGWDWVSSNTNDHSAQLTFSPCSVVFVLGSALLPVSIIQPTWNYAAVHAYGVPRLLSDHELNEPEHSPSARAMDHLVAINEAKYMKGFKPRRGSNRGNTGSDSGSENQKEAGRNIVADRSEPRLWVAEDHITPESLSRQRSATCGLCLRLTRVYGKMKLSQNKSTRKDGEAIISGVIDGLRRTGQTEIADYMDHQREQARPTKAE